MAQGSGDRQASEGCLCCLHIGEHVFNRHELGVRQAARPQRDTRPFPEELVVKSLLSFEDLTDLWTPLKVNCTSTTKLHR